MHILNMRSGFVEPPTDVEHVVTVGFLELWGDDGAGVDVDVHGPNDYYENLFVPKEGET